MLMACCFAAQLESLRNTCACCFGFLLFTCVLGPSKVKSRSNRLKGREREKEESQMSHPPTRNALYFTINDQKKK